MIPELELLSVVALTEELPEKGLRRGQVGTIVENLAPGVYEVEFSDDTGRMYASVALAAHQLLRQYRQQQGRALFLGAARRALHRASLYSTQVSARCDHVAKAESWKRRSPSTNLGLRPSEAPKEV